MATDLKPYYQEVEQQFTDLFYGKYMADQFGIEVGYTNLPDYFVTMQMQLLRWQQGMDCDNILCTLSRQQSITVESTASGTADTYLDQPCCNNNARFQPL